MSNDKRVTYADVLRAQAEAHQVYSDYKKQQGDDYLATCYSKYAADYRRMAADIEAAEQESAA